MTNLQAMPINDFCPLDCEIKTTDINGETWIGFDDELCDTLKYPASLYELLPYDEVQAIMYDNQERLFVSERLFYQIVLGSTAMKAIEFRFTVASDLIRGWYENGEPYDIQNAECLRHGTISVMGAIEAIVSEYLPISRRQQISCA